MAVFNTSLPSIALKQIGDICLKLLDRVLSIPNDWVKALSPLILWFSLHTEDGLVRTIFKLCPDLQMELSRFNTLLT